MSSSSSGGTSSIGKAYIKEREVSRGQHAKVYMAREVGTRRSLAVKVFDKPASLAEDMRRRQAIKHELKMLDAVRNGPHIIVTGIARYLNDLTKSVELPMQFYAEDLASLLERTQTERGLQDAFLIVPLYYYTVLAQMLKALVFLHSQNVNIIHRDIQPENILFEHPNGNPTENPNHFVLGHFGHASRASSPPSGHTDSLQFVAPEMYDGQKQTAAVDIWSLGMVCIEMAGWLPAIAGATTVDSMKKANWCNCMQELAKEIKSYRPEIEEMLRVDALERTTATQLLTKINSSIHVGSRKASPRLARLMIKKNVGPRVPEYHLETLVDTYLLKYDLVDGSEPANPTSEVSSRKQRAVITTKPRSTPPQLPPCLQLRGGPDPLRRKPLSSAPTTRPLIGSRKMMGPSRPAVLPPSRGSRRTATPTNPGATSLPSISQRVADSSAVAPILMGSEAEGVSARTVVTPQRSRSQEVVEVSEVIATPKRSQRKGAAKKSAVSPRPAQTYPNDGPSTTAKTSCESQATIEPASVTLKSRKIRSQQAKEPPRANATQISSPTQEAERLPRSVAMQESSTPERTEGAQGAAKASVPTGPQDTTTPSTSASRNNLETESPKNQRQATRQRGYSTAPQASSSAQLQSNMLRAAPQTDDTSKPTNSPRSASSSGATSTTHSQGQSSSGPRNPSQRLSANAPIFFPSDRPGNERDQALHANGRQPSRHSHGQGQETDAGARPVAHQASDQATQGGVQSKRPGVMLSAHQGPQSSPALGLAGTSPPMSPLNREIRSSPSLGQPALPPPVQSLHPQLQNQPNRAQAMPQFPPPRLHSAPQTSPIWTHAGVYTDLSPTLVGGPAQKFLVYAQVGECTSPSYLPQVQQPYFGPPLQSSPSQYYFYSGAQPYFSEFPSSQPPRHEAAQGQGNVDRGGQFPTGLAEVQGQSTGAQARPSPPLHMQPQNQGAGSTRDPLTSRHSETQSQQERVPDAVSLPQPPAQHIQRDSAPGKLPSPPNTEADTQQDRSPQRLPSAPDSVAHSQTNKEDEGEWEEPRHVRRRRSRKAIKGST